MRASRCRRVYLHPAELAHASYGRWRCGLLEQLRQPPYDERDDQKVEEDARKVSDTKAHRPDIPCRLLPVTRWRARSDNRHDEVIYDRLDHLADCTAKNDRDRECEKVLLDDEVPEIAKHRPVPVDFTPRISRNKEGRKP